MIFAYAIHILQNLLTVNYIHKKNYIFILQNPRTDNERSADLLSYR